MDVKQAKIKKLEEGANPEMMLGQNVYSSYRDIDSILARIRIPMIYRDSVMQRDAPTMWKHFNYKESYYLHGDIGNGKTHIMCSMLREQAYQSNQVKYYSMLDLINRMMKEFKSPPKMKLIRDLDSFEEYEVPDDNLIDSLKKVPVLALDDITAFRVSDWRLEQLFLLINHRYESAMVTYITGNANPDQLAKMIDGRIASRIISLCSELKVSGKDRRRSMSALEKVESWKAKIEASPLFVVKNKVRELSDEEFDDIV